MDITKSDEVYISQKAVVLNSKGEILVIRRTATAPSRPEAWDFPGGGLEFGEDPIVGITREIQEETGLTVTNVKPFDTVSFLKENTFTVMIAYQAHIKTQNIKLSWEHDKFQWIKRNDFDSLETNKTFKRFVKNLTI